MKDLKKTDLLKDRRVVEEINRHLWIESEKAGHDIGFDSAAVDWLEKFSRAWMQYYTPKKKTSAKVITKSKKKLPKTSQPKSKS